MNGIDEFTHGPLTLDETIKIISLLENLAEADPVRKALRFYEIPKHFKYKNYTWGENKVLMQVLEHFACPQNEKELKWMLEHIRGKTSLLEVGSSFGGTLKRMAAVMPRGSRIVSVDLPIDNTPQFLNPLASLKDTCRKLSLLGAKVELFVGDSHDEQVIAAVRALGPFDFVFIDGDHSYEGVKKDWENYGPMGKMVGFHDVLGPMAGCRRFWQELKELGEYRVEQCVDINESIPFYGIGIVFRED